MTAHLDPWVAARRLEQPHPESTVQSPVLGRSLVLVADDHATGAVAMAPARLMRLACGHPRSIIGKKLSAAGKRIVDVVLAATLLVLASPVMAAAAVMVRLSSRGPIFYSQERCGRQGRRFRMLKFRTMVCGADQLVVQMADLAESSGLVRTDAPAFKSPDDPRVTKVGRWLRRTSLDELPQLLNVLAGEMSLVGPRPLVAAEMEALHPENAEQRQAVRPGLTCLWQVLRREDTSFDERIELDVLYATRHTVALDLALIAMTPLSIIGGYGSF